MSRAAAGAPGVNLMPLLDVLLCTMGTLIVILGVINREARLHPAKRVHGKAAQEQQQMIEAQEDLQLRIDQLKGSKEKTLADLNTSRTKLAGIEDSKRKLEDQLQSLIDASKKLPDKNTSDDPQREKLRLELADLNSKRLQLESDLKKERNNASHRQPGFAVIPFDGMYKTSRRPIYIECRGDSVILQPEGIVFGPQDFLGPGGPSNPLACALRAAQEFWRNAPRPAPDMPNEPYPLLLVRPTGIIGYYLVRDAMSSWDAEFGYELVGEDWKLEYPNGPDAKLADMENRAVADSRQQLQWLAQVSPELFSRKSSKVEYHVSPFRGGVVRDGGPQLGNDPFAQDPLGGFGRSGRPGNSAMPGMNGPGGGAGGFAGGLADARGNSAFGTDPNATGSSGQGGLGNGQGGPGNSQSGLSNGQGGFGNGQGGSGNGGLAGGATGMPGTGGMPVGPGGMTDGTAGMGSGPDLANGGSGFSGGSGLGSANLGANSGGSGTGSPGSLSNTSAEVANVGPRYAGTGNGTAGFGNGTGNFSGTLGGTTGTSSQNPGSANGNSGYGATSSGNGNSSTLGDKTNSNGGANSFAGAPATRGSVPGGAAGTPSEYGGVLLPNSAGGMMNSSAGSGGGSGSSGGGGSGSGSAGSQGGQYAGGSGSYSAGGSSAGGSGASSGSASASGSSGGVTALGSPSGDPNASAGTPTLSVGTSSQQSPMTFDDAMQQQQQSSSSSSHSMSRNRGKNWALPTTHTSSVPVQRPIRVECWNDRLVLVPDTNDVQPQVIPLGQRTEDSLDPLVGAVRTYTKSWGIAGRGMYWRPQLVLNVNPNAEQRASDLQALLADSGWDVKKK